MLPWFAVQDAPVMMPYWMEWCVIGGIALAVIIVIRFVDVEVRAATERSEGSTSYRETFFSSIENDNYR